MHFERVEITEETADLINATKKNGGRIIAIGTTTVRTLEAAASKTGKVEAINFDTDIFIYPGFKFKCVDAILTNFHLPKSTLLMLVSAFAGRENILRAYLEAIDLRYRFFSYGDAMFIS
jgi:S-adenosylmethionine:tRNA ribosyltransferase-isomerase